ncbi:SET domain-containing protein 4 [Sitophilus oryzae]|uniref:SET domain-containing protein 4 n=1 Tax=Sitophilus oryzae TaxID=7048 RepID=A0A6J2XCD2_SITOR|nr:SET domain-containing protein 4 [Sitophilus oryzae]XP_030748615.1 SET domain-containing protein 4 [Sitophilus oryzae]
MGRTYRKRKRKRCQASSINLNHESTTINLLKWLNGHDFLNSAALELRHFPITGRGITSRKCVKENDVLIRIPMELLITFATVDKSGLLQCIRGQNSFSIHVLLSFFIAIEKHKKESSFWVKYIQSLPDPEPVLPWTDFSDNIQLFPDDIRAKSRKFLDEFNEGCLKLKSSINDQALCQCCKKTLVSVLDKSLFRWAYVLVNTRAVYIDPQLVLSMSDEEGISILSDKPSMALCPLLDMFNHHYMAGTNADVIQDKGQLYYELRTLRNYKKHEQFFICYGSHDNVRLLLEYGFFIPGNVNDCVYFNLKEIVKVLNVSLCERRYKFIKRHQFDDKDVYVRLCEASFNMKAVLFVCVFPNVLNYDAVVFSDCYPSEFRQIMNDCIKTLLEYKLCIMKEDSEKVSSTLLQSKHLSLLKTFLEYRIEFVETMLYQFSEPNIT